MTTGHGSNDSFIWPIQIRENEFEERVTLKRPDYITIDDISTRPSGLKKFFLDLMVGC